MFKKKLRLDSVLLLRDKLKELIYETQRDIVKYNNTEIKIDTLLELLKTQQDQFIVLKETVVEANKLKHDDGHTNNHYIFKLSNLKDDRSLYSKMNGLESNSQLDQKEITLRLKKISHEQDKIRTKLQNFNTSKYVTVELEKSLNLLNE